MQGEISNYKAHSSGHHYLTLKDEGRIHQRGAVPVGRGAAQVPPAERDEGHVRARVSSFPRTGAVQLYLSEVIPDGAGALNLAFEQLKNKLYAEGLFDESRKSPFRPARGTLRWLPLRPVRLCAIGSAFWDGAGRSPRSRSIPRRCRGRARRKASPARLGLPTRWGGRRYPAAVAAA